MYMTSNEPDSAHFGVIPRGCSPQLHSRAELHAELHSDEQNYTFDPLSDVIRSNWLQVALMSGLPIGIDQHPTDMPSPQ